MKRKAIDQLSINDGGSEIHPSLLNQMQRDNTRTPLELPVWTLVLSMDYARDYWNIRERKAFRIPSNLIPSCYRYVNIKPVSMDFFFARESIIRPSDTDFPGVEFPGEESDLHQHLSIRLKTDNNFTHDVQTSSHDVFLDTIQRDETTIRVSSDSGYSTIDNPSGKEIELDIRNATTNTHEYVCNPTPEVRNAAGVVTTPLGNSYTFKDYLFIGSFKIVCKLTPVQFG